MRHDNDQPRSDCSICETYMALLRPVRKFEPVRFDQAGTATVSIVTIAPLLRRERSPEWTLGLFGGGDSGMSLVAASISPPLAARQPTCLTGFQRTLRLQAEHNG